MSYKKVLTNYGVASGQFNDANEAAGFTYTTMTGELAPTQLTLPVNPYNAEILAARHVLEIGCGVGRNLPWIMENTSAHYYGLDPNPSMRRFFWDIQDPKWQSRVTIVSDFSELPSDVLFDLVISTFVLQHIGYRPAQDQMNVADICNAAMSRCADQCVWFLYEHDGEERWIERWMRDTGIMPQVYLRNFTEIPKLADRGPHHLIIYKRDGAAPTPTTHIITSTFDLDDDL